MRLRTRRFFFYSLVAIFIVVGGFLALATGGWVLNFRDLTIQKTGAMFLKYSPTDAQIYLNGALQNASPGFLSSGVFLPNLAPGMYAIRLAASGYDTWTKDLTVAPGAVAAASAVELWPQTWPLTPAATSTSDFWLTGSGAILETGRSLRWDRTAVTGRTVSLSDPGSSAIITESGGDYFWTDLASGNAPVNITNLFDSLRVSDLGLSGTVPIKAVLFHPFSGNRLLLVSENGVYELDLRRPHLSLLFQATDISAAAVSANQVFAVNASGTLSVFNLLLQTRNSFSTGSKNIVKLGASSGGGTIFLLGGNGALEEYSADAATSTTIVSDAADFWLSPGEERLAVRTDSGKLEMIALKNYWSDTKFTAGETWTISFPGHELDSFAWLPTFPAYGLTLSDGTLSVVELDPRLPQNASVIATGVSKFYVSGSDIFFLRAGTLESLDLGNL